jgi:uncharacterized membrane protein YidH (DUF202 family)
MKPVDPSWSRTAVSIIGLGVFLTMVVMAWVTKDSQMLNSLVIIAGNGFTWILGYWIGSSAGSDRKTELLGNPPKAP